MMVKPFDMISGGRSPLRRIVPMFHRSLLRHCIRAGKYHLHDTPRSLSSYTACYVLYGNMEEIVQFCKKSCNIVISIKKQGM